MREAGSLKVNQFRVGFVAYRDLAHGDKRFEVFPFNMDIAAFKDFVGSLKTDIGANNDPVEDV